MTTKNIIAEIDALKQKQPLNYKVVEGLNSGYTKLKSIAKLKGFLDSNKEIVVPTGYTIVSDRNGCIWNIIKD